MNRQSIKDFLEQYHHWKYMRQCTTDKNFLKKRNEHLIIKILHSIEKGLSMTIPKPGFGLAKLNTMLTYIEELRANAEELDAEIMGMISSVIKEYVAFNTLHEYRDVEYSQFVECAQRLRLISGDEKMGGSKEIKVRSMTDLQMSVEDCILSRHSIRDFSGEPLDMGKLMKAIELALHCPSACNRQAVHVYILDRTQIDRLGEYRDGGTAGFVDKISKMLLITGTVSAYEVSEPYQYIVSASIFAGYLSLTLHAQGIGACPIQRPVLHTKSWCRIAKDLGIPEDEQLVCMMAVGVPNGETMRVPLSYRISTDKLISIVENN